MFSQSIMHNQLEERIRRSSSFQNYDQFQDFMLYAMTCQDDLEVYCYMQQNQIGLQEPRFWLAKLQALRCRCQYKEVSKLLPKCMKNSLLMEYYIYQIISKKDFYKFQEFQETVIHEMTKYVRQRKGKRRRSVEEFQLFSMSKIQRSHRKVGRVNIYVDEDCRDNYILQDYADFFAKNLKHECQEMKNTYLRRQKHKPLSFISVQKAQKQQWAKQFFNQKQKSTFTNISLVTPVEQRKSFKDVQNISYNRRSSFKFQQSKKPIENPQTSNIYDTPPRNKSKKQDQKQIMQLTFGQSKKDDYKNISKEGKRKQPVCKKSHLNELGDEQAKHFIPGIQQYRGQNQLYKQTNQIVQYHGNSHILKNLPQLQNCKTSNSFDCIQLSMTLQKQFLKQRSQCHYGDCFEENNKSLVQQQQTSRILLSLNETINKSQNPDLELKIARTQTFQSIDSNQQNIFSNKGESINCLKDKKKERKRFQILYEQQLSSINNQQSSQSNFFATEDSNTKNLEQMILSLSDQKQKQSQNLVLETLRKKKLSSLIQDQNCRYIDITHSEKQKKLFPLQHISEQKSYNSQKKSLPFSYRNSEDSNKKQIKVDTNQNKGEEKRKYHSGNIHLQKTDQVSEDGESSHTDTKNNRGKTSYT